MLRTGLFACPLSKAEADALNAERGRIYTARLVSHDRLYRKQGVWLKAEHGDRWEDAHGGPTTLPAQSRAAAQQGVYQACKTARSCRQQGLEVKYPYQQKRWRTTIWKQTGIRWKVGTLLLSRAKGLPAVSVPVPAHLGTVPAPAFLEMRLVWDRAARHSTWHLVVEDGSLPAPVPGGETAAIDLGEIHPAAVTDGKAPVIITCRARRSHPQYPAKRLAELRANQDHQRRVSRSWKRLQRRKSRFLAQQKRRAREMDHKLSRAVVTWAKERTVGTLVIGDVRDVADGKRLNDTSQQKIGVWSQGRQRASSTSTAEAAGIAVTFVEEA